MFAENFSRILPDKVLHSEKSQNESIQGSGLGDNVYMNSTGTWNLLLCFSTVPCAVQSVYDKNLGMVRWIPLFCEDSLLG